MTRRKSSSARSRQRDKAQALSRKIQDNLAALTVLAKKGVEGAPKELHTAAVLATDWLNYLADNQPELFCAIAETRLSWPANYDPHPEQRDELELFLKSLRLGTKTSINASGNGKSFSWGRPANVVAVRLLRLAEALRREPLPVAGVPELARCGVGRRPGGAHVYNAAYEKQLADLEQWGQHGPGSLLPPLSKATAEQWARATPVLFRLVFGEEFDKHPKLQELKQSVSGKGVDGSRNTLRLGNIKRLMVQRVQQAFNSIAALD